jgi:hypothetical protein
MDVRLNIKPIFIGCEHLYYYEGPCRMAGGEALQPGFDAIVQGKMFKGFMENIRKHLSDKKFNVLEPSTTKGFDDWVINNQMFETLLVDECNTDVYLVFSNFGANTILEEFCTKTNKPIMMNPTKSFASLSAVACSGIGADIIPCFDWPELAHHMELLRAQKCVSTANLLLATRFSGTKAVAGGNDTFNSLVEVTQKLGTRFRYIDVHELMDQMKPLTEDGNYTTPGRKTPNITRDEIEELEKMADEIMADAEPCIVDRKFVVNSLIAWKQVQKNMDLYDCSGFSVPCPDACSTRRLNQIQFTFCFTHSLNLEQGFASACEFDVTAAVVMLLLMAVSGKSAFMGNTLPVVATEGRIEWPIKVNDDEVPAGITCEDAKHLYSTLHSTPCRHLHGIQQAADRYALRHFALDQGFGAIQRHDFNADKGQKITFCRISQDLKQMLIGTGEIAFGVGYDTDNCNGGFVFKVNDTRDLFKKQMQFGLHLPIVYGDYADDLVFIAKRMGLEPVVDKMITE